MAKYNPKDWTRAHEGFRDHFYFDSLGKLTIGVGHLVSGNPESNYYDENILNEAQSILKSVDGNINKANEILSNTSKFKRSEKELLKTYDKDYAKHEEYAKKVFPGFSKHPQNVQDALVNMTFQLGGSPADWNQFQYNLQLALETNDYSKAASAAAHSKWFQNQTPSRARSVLDRLANNTTYAYNPEVAQDSYSTEDIQKIYGGYEQTDSNKVWSMATEKHKEIPVQEKEEKEIPKVEEQSVFDRIGDFLSDTFGMGAEASDVPPMETLQEPQEEVPMSPTDAMRAQSQGRVILDSAQAVPTNPEAGPSDTVPAMLTPGEAVIPAAAAQDPDNKPVIEKMIEEGRAKNRMAEANGVPVNGEEAIMYDDAELDAYHKRNKTGKYGGGEMSLQGFAGGTMDVPAMIMMAPPKDPAMDEMEKLALKQMGYEMKSKNRTRDTIEKIGLKHLEDTATAEMRQAALDETMRNYGLEVPMPMQPVPQGFQDGTPGLYDERPSLSLGQQLLTGIAGPATGLYDNKTDAELAEIARFGSNTLEQSAAQRELSRRLAEVPTGTEVTQIDPVAPIKIAGSEATITPPQPVPSKTLVKAPPKVIGSSDVDVSDIIGGDKPDTRPTPGEPTLGETIGSAFKEVFDPTSLTKAAIAYGVNRAMGYDKNVATQQAAQQYGLEQKRMASAKATAAKRQADLEDYALKQRIAAGITSPKEDREAQLKFNNRLRDNLKATAVQVNRKVVKGKKTDEAEFNLGNTEQGFAAEATSFMRAQNIPIGNPEVQDQMDAIINQAYRDMVTYQRETGNKVSSITPFIRQNLRSSTLGASANDEFKLGTRDDGTTVFMDPRKSMDVDNLIDSEVNRMLKARDLKANEIGYVTMQALRRRVFEDMQQDFATFDQSTIKPGEEETPFYVFATEHYNK